MRMQLVEDLIKRVFGEPIEVDAENVGQRRAPDPVRHGVLCGRSDQSIERHRAGEPARRRRQLAVVQNAVDPEALPELVADMDRASLAVLPGRDPRRVALDQSSGTGRRRSRRAAALTVLSPRSHPTNDVGDLAILRVQQIALTDQRILDLARELQPFLGRPWTEVAKRADRLLARSLRGQDGLDQHIVDVRLALVGPGRFPDVHVPLRITEHPSIQGKISPNLVTILLNLRPRHRPHKQFQWLSRSPTSCRSKTAMKKLEVGLAHVPAKWTRFADKE